MAHITTDNPLALERLNRYTNFFMAKGSTIFVARQQALQAMENVVTKQSSQLSFSDAYLVVGLIFLIALPMLFFAAKKKGQKLQVILSDH